MAADLVRRQVKVIAAGTPGAVAAKAVTSTIPIVFVSGIDPVAAGLVASLNRPGGNLTGVSALAAELLPKGLELLHELISKAIRVALLVNPTNPLKDSVKEQVQAAAGQLGQQLQVFAASSDSEIETAFAAMIEEGSSALIVSADPYFESRLDKIVAFATRRLLPTVYPWRTATIAGGLMSYGSDFAEAYRQAGIYTGRILKGDRPSDLPVMQPTRFELVINLRMAKALGLTVPPMLLARADEVIE